MRVTLSETSSHVEPGDHGSGSIVRMCCRVMQSLHAEGVSDSSICIPAVQTYEWLKRESERPESEITGESYLGSPALCRAFVPQWTEQA